MKWINGITISLCVVVVGAKGASVVWQNIQPSLQMPLAGLDFLNKASGFVRGISFDPDDLTNFMGEQKTLTPQPSQKNMGKVVATAHTTGCMGNPLPTVGINTAQYLDFKASYPMDEETLTSKLDSYYCLVDPSKITLKQYESDVRSGNVFVARWLPANDLSEKNVLDVYITKVDKTISYIDKSGKAVTYIAKPGETITYHLHTTN